KKNKKEKQNKNQADKIKKILKQKKKMRISNTVHITYKFKLTLIIIKNIVSSSRAYAALQLYMQMENLPNKLVFRQVQKKNTKLRIDRLNQHCIPMKTV